MYTHQRIHIIFIITCLTFFFCMSSKSYPTIPESVLSSGRNPASYLVEKAASHRLILLGTQHKNKKIHDLICDILPHLVKEAGITTLFVEIPSTQQPIIERFKKGLCPANDICINQIIASQEYLDIIVKAKDLGMDIIAIDNDENNQITRDQWMASIVSGYLSAHPSMKGLVMVGNYHVYKNVTWATGENPTLADYLKPLNPFSVVMWHGAIEKGLPLALDTNTQAFQGIKDPTLLCMNVHSKTCLATSADGVIFIPE
jgi:hypothetical protein